MSPALYARAGTERQVANRLCGQTIIIPLLLRCSLPKHTAQRQIFGKHGG